MFKKYFLFFILLSCPFGVFAVGESPQILIGNLDASLPNIRKATRDSIKSSLSTRYMNDFRTYGQAAAYDSLRYRIRVLNASNEYNGGDTLNTKVEAVEQPLSEVDRLKRENQSLRNQLRVLLGPQPEANSRDLTLQEKRTNWIIKKFLIDCQAVADSFSDLYRDTLLLSSPLCLDSLSPASFSFFLYANNTPSFSLQSSSPSALSSFQTQYYRDSVRFMVRNKMISQVSCRNPSSVDYYRLPQYVDEMGNMVATTSNIHRLETVGVDVLSVRKENFKVNKKPDDPWTTSGKFAMQFSQYYVTDNWYKGGEPNATLLGIFDLDRDYKKGKKFWDNNIDFKLGFYSSSEDTIRAFRVNNDLVKISSIIGYQSMLRHWYYAASGEMKTQLFRSYDGTNSNDVKASFLSPTRIFLSLGTKYEYSSKVWAYLSPLAYKLLFVVNDDIEDPRSVGIEHGKVQNDFGLYGKGLVKYSYRKQIILNSSFDIFTPYNFRNVELNWDNVGTFVINRYFSTRLSLNLRFDSSPVSDYYDSPKLQIQEQLSFGFNYLF